MTKLYAIPFAILMYSQAYAQQIESTQTALTSAFNSIGYDEVEIQGCEVSYMREIQPSVQNSGYFALWRYLDLDSLRGVSEVEVYSLGGADTTNFLIDLDFDDEYRERYFPMLQFGTWVDKEYPESRWPYRGPNSQDEFSALIEFELHRRVAGINKLNRVITFTNYGPITDVEAVGTTIASHDKESIEALLASIRAYSNENYCDIEN